MVGTSQKVLAAARLLVAAGPRAVASVVAGALRSEATVADTGVPRLRRSGRVLGEAALDEFLIAVEAVRRSVPDLDHVTRQATAARRVAEQLAHLGPDDLHVAPGRLRESARHSSSRRPIAFEEVEFTSASAREHPLANAVPWPAQPTSRMRVLQHAEPRPWLIWVHGAGMGGAGDLVVFRARVLHEHLGFNVAFPVLPGHGLGRGVESFPTIDPMLNLAHALRAVRDLRAVIRWAHEQTPAWAADSGPAVVGTSLGGALGALAASLEPGTGRVATIVPMLDMHATIARHVDHAGGRGREIAALLRAPAVQAFDRALRPGAPPPTTARLVVGAVNDRMTYVPAVAALARAWKTEPAWHHGGHVGHLLSRSVRTRLDTFLAEAAPTPASDAVVAPASTG